MSSQNNKKDTTIDIFSGTLWEAEMIRTLLKNVEINSFLRNTTLNSYAFDPISAVGVKVVILNSDSEKANIIIADYYKKMKENG